MAFFALHCQCGKVFSLATVPLNFTAPHNSPQAMWLMSLLASMGSPLTEVFQPGETRQELDRDKPLECDSHWGSSSRGSSKFWHPVQ